MNNKYIGKFRFDLLESKCVWLKENGEEFEIPKEWSGSGKIAHQKWFQLEGEKNQGHWVNFSTTYSQGKVWVNVWYKKDLESGRNDYFLKVEKSNDIMEITITEKDEMIKVYDDKKQKERWIKKINLGNNNHNQSQRTTNVN